jgi:hypothetical protein
LHINQANSAIVIKLAYTSQPAIIVRCYYEYNTGEHELKQKSSGKRRCPLILRTDLRTCTAQVTYQVSIAPIIKTGLSMVVETADKLLREEGILVYYLRRLVVPP